MNGLRLRVPMPRPQPFIMTDDIAGGLNITRNIKPLKPVEFGYTNFNWIAPPRVQTPQNQ